MIAPARERARLPCLRGDRHAQRHNGPRGEGAGGTETERRVRGALRFPRAPRRSDQTFALGWAGLLPLLQGSGEGPFSMAVACRRIRASHSGATRDVVGGHRLAPWSAPPARVV